jgi:hypothetical protein
MLRNRQRHGACCPWEDRTAVASDLHRRRRHLNMMAALDDEPMAAIYRSCEMLWTPNDAQRHTHKATTPALQELWAKVANEAL